MNSRSKFQNKVTVFGLRALLSLALPLAARAAEEIVEKDQPGTLRTKEREVSYQAMNKPESPAVVPQALTFGDAVRTRLNSSATVRLKDTTAVRLRELTRLVIIPRGPRTNMSGVKLLQGEILTSHRGQPTTVAVETPDAKGTPFGTEFLVSFDPVANETVFTMFDGDVELDNGVDKRRVMSGFQGIAVPGQKIRVQPILEAKNLVQWWIYYPAVVATSDLEFTASELQSLNASLAAYNFGDLRRALEQFPGYPDAPSHGSESSRLFFSALLLGVGDVAGAEKLISDSNSSNHVARALRTMIDAVAPPLTTNTIAPRITTTDVSTASEQLALSYAHQATNNLEAALRAARVATERAPEFGFAWARVAELEFSFGHTPAASVAADKALALSPRHGQAHALRGFLLAARNQTSEALRAFDDAIALDSALANGWLGRGLVKIRRGDLQSGRNDLETAAILEPRRALLRSYTGKAFTDAGNVHLATQELRYAQKLDGNDPTPWLYSALLAWQEHRINAAVDDLEHSIALNDNRALYRSRLLLDQDRAVRGANLANIYESAGLNQVALNEAARSVSYDQGNYSAHLFLSESFNALRDPTRFNLRYETPWFGEFLLANLLSPVGATPLSQNISQQEYSRLFARDHAGLSSDTLVRSDGEIHELASQFGNFGNTAWALDLDYQHNDGVRRNNRLDRTEWYTTVKQQLTPQDSVLLLFKYQDFASGDNFQYYNAKKSLDPDYHFEETQHPIALAGYHREWSPGVHTLFLGGRLANEQKLTDQNVPYYLLARRGAETFVPGSPLYDVRYQSEFEAYTAELSQIFQTEHHTLTLGARFQDGELRAKNSLQPTNADMVLAPFRSSVTEPADRVTGYGYYDWRICDSLLLIGGVSYDLVTYPRNLRSAPITAGSAEKDLLAPKAGAVWTPLNGLTFRGAYTRSLGGVTLDQSYRLEPTQIAGFVQTYRTLLPISLTGPVSAQEFETAGAAMELKLPTRTYVTLQLERVSSGANNTRGVVVTDIGSGSPTPAQGGGTREKIEFVEHSAELTVAQLLDEEWSVGARYRFARASLHTRLPELEPQIAVAPDANVRDVSDLHAATVFMIYNHRSGFFAGTDFSWYMQNNREHGFAGGKFATRDLPSDNFPQWNVAVGWRFPKHHGDVTLGVLNLTDDNYHLSPVNFYNEMPHERVFYGRLRFRF